MSIAKKIASSIFGNSGRDARTAANFAASTQAGYQQQALDYLKEREALPTQFREGAMKELAGLYGLEGGTGSQEEMIKRLMETPLYKNLMAGREQGEDVILRSAAATGGLRSGNVQDKLFTYDTQLANDALLQAWNNQLQGLSGFANLPSNAANIANQTSAIGQTLGQGQVAGATAKAQADQNNINNLMGLIQTGAGAFSAAAPFLMFSDRRLKKDIEPVGEIQGHRWYTWTWNSIANRLGLTGKGQGIMADEIFDSHPEALGLRDGFIIIDYRALGVM